MTPKRRSSRLSGKTGLLKEDSDRREKIPERAAALRKSPRICALQQARSADSAKGLTETQDIAAVTFAKASTNATASSSRTVRSRNGIGQSGKSSVGGKGKLLCGGNAGAKNTFPDKSGGEARQNSDKADGSSLEAKGKTVVVVGSEKKTLKKETIDKVGAKASQKKGAVFSISGDPNAGKANNPYRKGRNSRNIDQALAAPYFGIQDRGKLLSAGTRNIANKQTQNTSCPSGTRLIASETESAKDLADSACGSTTSVKPKSAEQRKAGALKTCKSESANPSGSGNKTNLPSTSGRGGGGVTKKKLKEVIKEVASLTKPAEDLKDKRGRASTTSKLDFLCRQY